MVWVVLWGVQLGSGSVEADVGTAVGVVVGAADGDDSGARVGVIVDAAVGVDVGAVVGAIVCAAVGADVEADNGAVVGAAAWSWALFCGIFMGKLAAGIICSLSFWREWSG